MLEDPLSNNPQQSQKRRLCKVLYECTTDFQSFSEKKVKPFLFLKDVYLVKEIKPFVMIRENFENATYEYSHALSRKLKQGSD